MKFSLPIVTYPDSIRSQFQIAQFIQAVQAFDSRDLVLDKVKVRQLLEMLHILDMLDLIEAEIEASQVLKFVQAFHV